MKISIITVCYNSADTLAESLDSVASQNYSDIEHIIVDGGSDDVTEGVVNEKGWRVAVWRSESDQGVYDGMNKGLLLASGEVIGFLNADDVYMHSDVLTKVAATMADSAIDACYANLVYVDRKQTSRVIRHWTSQNYEPGLFEKGWMPAHPTFFVRKSVYERLGGFNLRYRLQSDFDLALRFIGIHDIRTRYIPEVWVRMRMGGMSNNSIRNVIRGNIEAYLSCRANGLKVLPWFILSKVFSRLPQFVKAHRVKLD